MKRPRLEYQVAIYHRSVAAPQPADVPGLEGETAAAE
jgi:hypothetical protein